jgi:hypothetical protein
MRLLNLLIAVILVCVSYLSFSYIVHSLRHPEKPLTCSDDWWRMLSLQ